MPTTLDTPSNSNAKVRFREPYVSEGLNKKFNGVAPAGVVRGGQLVTAGAGLSVTLEADPEYGDSIYSYIDAGGNQVTFRQSGPVNLDLSPDASTTVYVALYIEYNTSSDTVVEWRSYTEAELFGGSPVAEADEVVIVGKVVVPGSGPIPSSNVSMEDRRSAWANKSREIRDWLQVVQDGSFELNDNGSGIIKSSGSINTNMPHWDVENVPGNDLSWEFFTGRTGRLSVSVSGLSTSGWEEILYQRSMVRVIPERLMRVSVWLEGNTWSGTDVLQGVRIQFRDETGVISEVDVTDNSLSGSFSFTEVNGTIEVPAGAIWARIGIGVETSATSISGDLRFDDVNVWVEGGDPLEDPGVGRMDLETISGEGINVSPSIVSDVSNVDEAVRKTLRTAYDGTVSSVVGYASKLISSTLPWALKFVKGSLDLGDGLTGTQADALISRLKFRARQNDTPDRTLLQEIDIVGISEKVRIYLGEDTVGGANFVLPIEVSFNARWNGTQWVADDTGAGRAILLTLGGDSSGQIAGFVRVQVQDPVSSAWTSFPTSGFAQLSVQHSAGNYYGNVTVGDGEIQVLSPGTHSNPSTPSATDPNTLLAKMFPKAWAHITSDGAGGATIQDGLGVSSVSIPGTVFDITLANPMASSSYAPMAVLDASAPAAESAYPEITDANTIKVFVKDGTSTVDVSANAREIYVFVFGEQ